MASTASKKPYKPPQTDTEFANVLKGLRDKAAGIEELPEALLHAILDFVMRAPKIGSEHHWFCAKAPPLLVEAATFILRLFAYRESTDVERMRERLSFVLDGCCDCVHVFQNAKWSSRLTYLSCFPAHILDDFWAAVDKWETNIVRAHLRAIGMPSTTRAKLTLNSLPPPVVYHCVANPQLLADADIWDILATYCPSAPIPKWPTVPAPGLFLLLAHASLDVRTWAAAQLAQASELTNTALSEDHKLVISALACAVLPQPLESADISQQVSVWNHRLNAGDAVLWPAFLSVLKSIPPSALTHRVTTHNRVYHTVIGHLNDNGSHFDQVLRCFAVLLRKLGDEMWSLEGEDYPQVVFFSIKDNPAFVALLRSSDSLDPWIFAWLEPFIISVWNKPAFADIVAKTMSFMCEELQHERFEVWHPLIMTAMAKTLLAVMQKSTDAAHSKAIRASFDIHAKTIVNVALSAKSTESWSSARSATRSLLAYVLLADIRDMEVKAQVLSVMAGKDPKQSTVPPVMFGKSLWELTFRTLQGDGANANSIAFIIPIIAQSSLLDTLRPASYPYPTKVELQPSFKAALRAINEALEFLQSSFAEVADDFTSGSTSSKSLEAMLGQTAIIHPVVTLLYSPSSTLRNAAQSIISHAYGNDGGRADCFRVLLEKSPEAVLRALTRVNDTFSMWAGSLSEACKLSQTLVLCLSDILEVLCSRSGGLLFEKSFVFPPGKTRPTRLIVPLWCSMCKALSAIFKRTPQWSAYYENKIMLEWMRDALIFGRDLLTYRSTLEGAALAADSADTSDTISSPRKLSSAGKQMVEDLQVVLKEVINWLRLTDAELLYQSLNLLRSLFECFRKTGTQPAPEPMQKLERFLDKARQRADSNDGDDTTRLSAVDLASLSEDMASFDDDVQIVDPPPRAALQFPGTSSKKRASSPTEALASRKQAKSQSGSSASSKASHSETKSSKSTKPELASIFKSGATRSVQPFPPVAKPAAASTQTKVTPLRAQPKARAAPPPRPAAAPEPPKPFTIGPSDRTLQEGRGKATAAPAKSAATSDASTDDEDDNSGLAGLEKVQRSPPKIRKPEERRQVKMISISGQEISRQQRTVLQDRTNKLDQARRISLRLKPDLTPLHRRILSWDYDHTGDSPWPRDAPALTAVPAEFGDHQQYMRIFEPLLLHECWSQLVKSKEESNIPVLTCSITGKGYVDDWIEVEILISEALPQKWFLAETDIVLLRHPSEPAKKLLAKVHASTISQRANRELRATLRCTPNTNGDPGIQVGTNWRFSKVFSLSTVHREFASLVALPYYDLFHDIVQPRAARLPAFDASHVKHAMMSHRVNEPQAKAILASTQTDGFLLIQGPPGTGKTSTICGIVGAFLSNRPKPATVIQVGRVAAPGKPQLKKKILICAPSNAGIDEVAKRLRDGVLDSSGQRVVPKIVRVGIDTSVNASVKDLTLDFLVDQKLAGPGGAVTGKEPKDDTNALRAELQTLRATLDQKFIEIKALQDRGADSRAIQNDINALKNKRLSLSKRLDDARDKQKADNRAVDAARRKFRAEVLQEADVICSTLAGAGHDTLESFDFETVVIDEAAQSIELSSLIPLKYGCRRCIMVGDPQQLPPTVISPIATRHNYNQSLFVRIYNQRPQAAHLLSIQYRMHPDISRIPSKLFYEGRLIDGPEMAAKTQQPWHASSLLGPYRFFNVAQGHHEAAHAGHSLINRAECDAALALYDLILRDFRQVDLNYRVGVISMYKAQITAMKNAFMARYGAERASTVDFNTVDGFQGQEKDVIILSCVRAGPAVQSIGFLSDVRRLNVSITRARSSLFILGHAATLQRSDDTWKYIVEDARSRSALIDVGRNTFTSATTARADPVAIQAPIARATAPTPSARRQSAALASSSSSQQVSGLMTPQALAKASPAKAVADRPHMASLKRGPDETPLPSVVSAKRPRTSGPDGERSGESSSASTSRADIGAKQPGPPPAQLPRGNTKAAGATNKPSVPPKPRPKKAAPTLFIPKKKPAPG